MSANHHPEHVWTEYRSALTLFLKSKVANQADVEDLLQEILLKVHRSGSSLNKSESLKSWLFQIAHNTIIDFYRQKGSKKSLDPIDLWSPSPETDEAHLLEECVVPFIDALPREMADLLRKIELEGVSQKRYAEQVGLSYSTLKSRVQKSRSRLKQLFDECCDFELDANGNITGYTHKSSNCGGC